MDLFEFFPFEWRIRLLCGLCVFLDFAHDISFEGGSVVVCIRVWFFESGISLRFGFGIFFDQPNSELFYSLGSIACIEVEARALRLGDG